MTTKGSVLKLKAYRSLLLVLQHAQLNLRQSINVSRELVALGADRQVLPEHAGESVFREGRNVLNELFLQTLHELLVPLSLQAQDDVINEALEGSGKGDDRQWLAEMESGKAHSRSNFEVGVDIGHDFVLVGIVWLAVVAINVVEPGVSFLSVHCGVGRVEGNAVLEFEYLHQLLPNSQEKKNAFLIYDRPKTVLCELSPMNSPSRNGGLLDEVLQLGESTEMLLVFDKAGDESKGLLADVIETILQGGLPVLNMAEYEVFRGVERDISRKLPGKMANALTVGISDRSKAAGVGTHLLITSRTSSTVIGPGLAGITLGG